MRFPKDTVRLSITTSCNMQCSYCHNEGNSKEQKDLSVDQIERIILASLPFGLKTVRITGGEPLIARDIGEICYLLRKKYSLRIEINTNAIEIETLMSLINLGLISRVVVGIDYYDSPVSKDSPIGCTSSVILQNIRRIKESGCKVDVDTVFQGDYENISSLVGWCINEKIRIKILELVGNKAIETQHDLYHLMSNRILSEYHLKPILDEIGEIHGYEGERLAVSFFHSLCQLKKCGFCQENQMRITCGGIMKPCIIDDRYDVDLLDGDTVENMRKGLILAASISNQ